MKKKALFYAPFAIWPYHFETELELIETCLNKNYEVTLLSCTGQLPTCDANPNHERWICRMCKSRHKAGIDWVGKNRINIEDFYWVTPEQQVEIECLEHQNINTLDELRTLELEGSDIGLAALSSLDSYREPNPDIEKCIYSIKKNLTTAAIVHFSIKNHLATKNPDIFFVCNGRFSAFRPALRVAQQLGIETYVHERSGVLDKYSLSRNTYPHDLDAAKHDIEETYQKSNLPESIKVKIAYSWYEERLNNQIQGWFSFTENQQKNLLPEKLINLPSSTVKVAIFNSSEDEFLTFDEWKNQFYLNQDLGIHDIAETFKDEKLIQFFLRIHPSLAKVGNSQTQFLEKLKKKFDNLEIINADSEVSTYALIKNCDLVLTFGSTVGIEALYQHKPSILMGRSLYEDLDGIIKPKSHEDLIVILKNYLEERKLPVVKNPDQAVIKYGFFQKEFGHNFQYAKPYEISKVSLIKNGKEVFINPDFLAKVLNKLKV